MISDVLFSTLLTLLLMGGVWLCLLLHWVWPYDRAVFCQRPSMPATPRRKRSQEPQPFAGLTTKPHCAPCEQSAAPLKPPPPAPPEPMPVPNRRPRQVDTSTHFCPHAPCAYQGWVGLGNLRANGHPNGGPWRQFHCTACGGYVLETHGTLLHGKRVPAECIVRVIACLAEGLGIRGTARVFEVDPNTVLQWLVEAADHLKAFSQYFLHDVRVTQVQLDELYALLSAVKDGEVSEVEALQRLSRSPRWVWGALDPVIKLLLTIDVGDRTLAMAQRVVHQVVQVLAPGCVPLFLTDGFKEYMTALLAHYGHWVQPSRRRAQGPAPKPRWMPLPELLYAQVVKSYRCRRVVRVRHRVVFGTLARVNWVLAATGWQINTAFIERVNGAIRQHVAAVGRRVITLCKGEDGLRQQLVLYQMYHNFCLPHAALRQSLPHRESTHGSGSAKRWRPRTPAMAAGLTDHVWTLREVLLFRVPPWPQPHAI
jgi:IS1 family transposase